MRKIIKFQNPAGKLGFTMFSPDLNKPLYSKWLVDKSSAQFNSGINSFNNGVNNIYTGLPQQAQPGIMYQSPQFLGGNWSSSPTALSQISTTTQQSPQQSVQQTDDSSARAGGKTMNTSWLKTGLNIATTIGNAFVKPDEDSTYSLEQGAGDALMRSGNPYAMAAGALVKLNSMGNQALGTNINTMTDRQYKRAGLNGFQNALNTGLGFLSNTATIGLGGLAGKTEDFSVSLGAKNLRDSFAGALNDMDIDASMAGKRYWIGKRQVDRNIERSKQLNNLLTALDLDTNNVISSVPYMKEQLQRQRLNKMYNIDNNVSVGKNGLKLLSKEELAAIYSTKQNITKFQEGGSIMIPDGALHAHKHHMEDVNPDLAEDLTSKGIPVVTESEGGELTQVAEVEKEEAILSSSLTDKIESLWKDGSEEAMIEAGKLIVEALFTDTVDNSGIIDKVE